MLFYINRSTDWIAQLITKLPFLEIVIYNTACVNTAAQFRQPQTNFLFGISCLVSSRENMSWALESLGRD